MSRISVSKESAHASPSWSENGFGLILKNLLSPLLFPSLGLNDIVYTMGLDNLFAWACEILNPVERFEIHLVVNLGSKKGQVVILPLERCLGISL